MHEHGPASTEGAPFVTGRWCICGFLLKQYMGGLPTKPNKTTHQNQTVSTIRETVSTSQQTTQQPDTIDHDSVRILVSTNTSSIPRAVSAFSAEFKCILGKGGHSVVYHMHGPDGPYVLKLPITNTECTLRAFKRERAAATNIAGCENVVKYKFFDERAHAIGMELHGDGLTIADIYWGGGKYEPTWKNVLWSLIAIAGAVAKIHKVGVIHNDIKPSNILVSNTGTPELWLSDFGCSVIGDPGTIYTNEIPAKDWPDGTIRYMAPEKLLTAKSDIFGLGLTMRYMATGEDHCRGMTDNEVLSYHSRGCRSFLPSTVPTKLATIIMSCMHHDARDRPTAARVVEQLCADGVIPPSMLDMPRDA